MAVSDFGWAPESFWRATLAEWLMCANHKVFRMKQMNPQLKTRAITPQDVSDAFEKFGRRITLVNNN